MSSAEGSRSPLPATRTRPVSITGGQTAEKNSFAALLTLGLQASVNKELREKHPAEAPLGEKVRRGGSSFQTRRKPASLCRRQHDSESRAPGPCGIKPPGTSSGVHLPWHGFRDPQWEEVGWSKLPGCADIPLASQKVPEEPRLAGDSGVGCDVLAAFLKQIREQWQGYPNTKLLISLSLLHSERPVINGGL